MLRSTVQHIQRTVAKETYRPSRALRIQGRRPRALDTSVCLCSAVSQRRCFSSDTTRSPASPASFSGFAVVDHSAAYTKAMAGLHGRQLALAQLEGEGKDDPDFDPFLEEELAEARRLAEEEGNDDEEYDMDEADSEDEDEETDALASNPHAQRIDRTKFNNDGSLKRNASEKAILRAGSPAGGVTAVVALAGSQYKVTTDDVLIVNRLKPVSKFAVGTIHTLDTVLLVSSSACTLVGMPMVAGAQVDVLVEEITMDAKVVVFKKRRRKNSQRKRGFRRDVTMLRILDVRFPAAYVHDHLVRPDPAPLVRN